MEEIFARRKARLMELRARRKGEDGEPKRLAARPVFDKCPSCGAVVPKTELSHSLYVCTKCGYHHTIGAYLRLAMLLDSKSFRELDQDLVAPNVLGFPGYEEKLERQRDKTGLMEAVVTARGRVEGRSVAAAALDSRFLMGSMGTAVGEKVARAAQQAGRRRLPLVIFAASGGARMQEGIFSLMQMAKTAAAIDRFQKRGGLYISCLTHPTTGGVTASFASLGDIMLAEPGALIGFAGPRVIEQTIGEKLPEGFQSAEALLQNGFLDQIVPRAQWRAVLSQVLLLHEGKKGGAAL